MSSAEAEVESEEVFDLIETLWDDDDENLILAMVLATDTLILSALRRLRRRAVAFKNFIDEKLSQAQADGVEQLFNEYRDKWMVVPAGRQKSVRERLQRRGVGALTASMVPITETAMVVAKAEVWRAFVKCIFSRGGQGEMIAFESSLAKFTAVSKYAPYVRNAGLVLTVGLLGYEFYVNIRRWYKGEIDGLACTRNITASCGGACAGLALGFVVGSVAGVPGAIVGSLVGGVLAGEVIHGAFNIIAGDDRKRSLHSSYDVLGLSRQASAEEIKRAYHALALQHHPDKGGDKTKFIEVNMAYELIRAELLA